MSPSARKAIGCLALLTYLTGFIIAAVMVSERVLTGTPWWAQLLYFIVAGVIWALPL